MGRRRSPALPLLLLSALVSVIAAATTEPEQRWAVQVAPGRLDEVRVSVTDAISKRPAPMSG